jgi:hypothetical protein
MLVHRELAIEALRDDGVRLEVLAGGTLCFPQVREHVAGRVALRARRRG